MVQAGGSRRVRTIAASSRRISSQAVTFKQLTVFPISSPGKEASPLNLAERVARRYLISSAKELTVLFYRAISALISFERARSKSLYRFRFSLFMTPQCTAFGTVSGLRRAVYRF